MAETFQGNLAVQITALLSAPGALSTPTAQLNLQTYLNAAFGNGVGANNANQLFVDQQETLAASGSLTYDLNAFSGALDMLGFTFNLANVKMIAIQILGNAQVYSCTVATVHSGGGGTGYQIGDVLTIAPGTGQVNQTTTLAVTTVSSGVITGLMIITAGSYSISPTTSANAVTGGHGTGATVDLTFTTSISLGTAVFTEADFLTIGQAGSNPWTSPFVGTTPGIKLKSGTSKIPGTWIICEGGASGYAVASGSNQNLKITNSGSNPITFNLIVFGATS